MKTRRQEPRGSRVRRQHDERGLYLVLMAVISVALIGLCALAIGAGQITFNQVLQQNIVNLAGLGALEAFVDEPGNGAQRYIDKTNAGLARAKEILAANRLKGMSGSLGQEIGMQGDPGDDGEIQFGKWYENDSDANPCEAPCFFANAIPSEAPSNETANAVKLTVRNASTPFIVPFGGVFGRPTAVTESSAVGVVAPRCVTLLMDVSRSIVGDTHERPREVATAAKAIPPAPAEFVHNQLVVTDPEHPGVFAVRRSAIDGDCRAISSFDELSWCNTQTSRDPSDTVDPLVHYKSDYQVHQVSSWLELGDVYVDAFSASRDGYAGPEPYTSILHAFNAGIRLLGAQASPSDQVMMLVFAGDEVDRLPRTGGMTTELDLLAQMTNLDNIGREDLGVGDAVTTTTRIVPNAVSEGWFYLYGRTDSEEGSNIVYGVQAAIEQLSDPDVCPSTAKRLLILATDGLATCSADADNVVNCSSTAGSYYPRYVESRASLLGPVLQKLREEKISFSVIVAGGAVNPNFLNILNPDYVDVGNPDDPSYFLNQEQAISRGYGGVLQPAEKRFFRFGAYKDGAETGYQTVFDAINQDQQGYEFSDPIGVLGELVFQTGGVYCPLLRTGARSRYTDTGDPRVLKREFRTVGAAQTEAIEYRTLGEAAALCVIKAVGTDPYALRYDE